MVTVVTGWTGSNYDYLGNQFIETFKKHWRDTRLIVFRDSPNKTTPYEYSLWDECLGLPEFVGRHRGNPVHCGKRVGDAKRWKPREYGAGYSFRFDAVRFAPQMFMPEAAAQYLEDGEILAWFDADVVTFKDIPDNFIESLIGDSDIVYLGREPKHSEIGFWAVRLSPETRGFLDALASVYVSDRVFDLDEWHSAYVFDAVRKMTEFAIPSLQSKDLTPGGRGHVWFQCVLGNYTDHLKGNRKKVGRSKERKK